MFALFEEISPESKGVLDVLNLDKYEHKGLPERARFVDTSQFRVRTKFADRYLVAGSIGRRVRQKGTTELVGAFL